MIVKFNYHQEHILQVPFLLEKAFRSMPNITVIGPNENIAEVPDLVINSMPWKGPFMTGKKTVYWELDMVESVHTEVYTECDVVYFPSNYRKDIWLDNGKFLPMAVDMEYFHPIENTPVERDVVFMGRLDRSLRKEYIDRLKGVFDIHVGQAERGIPTSKELSRGMCSFQISEFSNLEQRNFEYSAVVPMVLERVPDLEVFTEGEHYRGFDRDSYEEFKSQINWCVKNYEESLKMRDRMIEHLKQNHLYTHRANTILEDIS